MIQRKIKFFLSLFLIGYSVLTLGWISAGHRVIAEIAYRHLTPDAKERAYQLLQNLESDYPAESDFITVASWMDNLRRHQVGAYSHWHYVDLPLVDQNYNGKVSPIDTDNIIWALEKSEVVLKSKYTNPYEKGFFLRVLIHLVGDIHQPLHCVTWYSKIFPEGDKGGHSIKIHSLYGKNLHELWDMGLGLLVDPEGKALKADQIKALAEEIDKTYAGSLPALQTLSPEDWANEHKMIALEKIYKPYFRDGLGSQVTPDNKELVRKQLALAGLRLAALCNAYFQEEKIAREMYFHSKFVTRKFHSSYKRVARSNY